MDQHRLRSMPTHKWIPLLCSCFCICVVCRHSSLLDLKQVLTQDITHQVRRKKDRKQRRDGVFHSSSTNSLSGGGRGVKWLIICTMQAKLILEKMTTCFFDIYFTFLFIHTFVSHFHYITFFLKSHCNFFLHLCLEHMHKV